MIRIVMLLLMISACSRQPVPEEVKENQYKEALLRSRNVFSVDQNIDKNSSASIDFYQQYPGQLVEINFRIERMNSFQITPVNSDAAFSKIHLEKNIMISELMIELDGADITACIIEECNSTYCHGLSTDILSFSEELSTSKLYLNLTKLSQSDNSICSNLNFSEGNKIRTLTFKEAGDRTGGRISAQVIVYNRTYRANDMLNLFQ